MTLRIGTRLILMVTFAVTVAAVAAGQTTKPDPESTIRLYLDPVSGMDSDGAVKQALANNDQLRAMEQEARASGALVAQADQRKRSSISFESRQQAGGNRNRAMVTGSVPLEIGGRRSARVAVAERKAELDKTLLAESERQLAAEVRSKFGSVLAKALKLKITEEALLFVFDTYDLVRSNVKEGYTAPLDQNMLLVELNRLRSKREKDEGQVRIAMLELKNLLGLGPETPLRVKGDFKQVVEPLPSAQVATERALEHRTDLLALQAAADLAGAKIEQEKKESGIDASLKLGYERMTDNVLTSRADHMVIFGASILLPYGNLNRDAIEASVFERSAAERRLAFGRLVVRREVAAAITRYEHAVKALEIFRVGVMTEALRNLEVVKQSYELGSTSLIDYLSEQGRYLDYQSGLIDAQLEVYLAKVEMMKAGNEPALM